MDPWIKRLIESATSGNLCEQIEDVSSLPPGLWSYGDKALAPTPLVVHGNRLYLQRCWALETLCLEALSKLLAEPPKSMHDSDRFVQLLDQIPLQPAQRSAISRAFNQRLILLTGGPGTGKTYTASALIRLFGYSSLLPLFKVAIAAPTGKAAAHLEAALQAWNLPSALVIESTTLHRLLRLQPGTQHIHRPHLIDAHLVVVDEASMLDVSLMLHLFQAIGPQTRLLLLGDPDQLPPVDGPSLFPDLAELFGSKLERSMRTEQSELAELSSAIQRSDLSAVTAYADRIPLQLDAIKKAMSPNRRILSTLRKGPFGADILNQELLAHATPNAPIPILITENVPRLRLYNGSSGVLLKGTAHFNGFSLPEAELPKYETAFCLSVHKSQGSEFDEVIVLLPPGSEQFGKQALYTAVTRAKRRAILAADDATLATMLRTNSRSKNGLKERYCNTI